MIAGPTSSCPVSEVLARPAVRPASDIRRHRRFPSDCLRPDVPIGGSARFADRAAYAHPQIHQLDRQIESVAVAIPVLRVKRGDGVRDAIPGQVERMRLAAIA